MLDRSIFRLPQVLPSEIGSGSDNPRGTCLILLSTPCLYLATGISPGVFFVQPEFHRKYSFVLSEFLPEMFFISFFVRIFTRGPIFICHVFIEHPNVVINPHAVLASWFSPSVSWLRVELMFLVGLEPATLRLGTWERNHYAIDPQVIELIFKKL